MLSKVRWSGTLLCEMGEHWNVGKVSDRKRAELLERFFSWGMSEMRDILQLVEWRRMHSDYYRSRLGTPSPMIVRFRGCSNPIYSRFRYFHIGCRGRIVGRGNNLACVASVCTPGYQDIAEFLDVHSIYQQGTNAV